MEMKCLAIQSSPNREGLTASLAQAVLTGVTAAGGTTELVHLNEIDIHSCLACETGWGRCREENRCVQEDGFEALRTKMAAVDALVFATPVYFHDLSESAKRLLDRLRRCEAFEFKSFAGKQVIGIASAGGSGRGAVRALYHLEEYLRRLGFEVFDLVSVTRFSKDHKVPMLEAAGRRLAQR